jgi:hypothetical protein
LYSHIMYNSMLVGFEAGWLEGDRLSPIGRIQQAANHWTRKHGQPGAMQTPIALLIDFYSGWSFPRHLYTQNVYRVWGNLPYGPGDYLTEGVLDLIYPGYQDSSYFHDESGFLAPTPYGDSADVLLSDVPGWLLARYPVLVVAGELMGGAEIRDKLEAYVESGGRLVITAGNLVRLPGGLGAVETQGSPIEVGPSQEIELGGQQIAESSAFEILPLKLPPTAKVLARAGTRPLVAEVVCGKGRITIFASKFGVPRENVLNEPVKNQVDRPLAKPYPILKHARFFLDQVFREQTLFDAGEGLSLIVCRRNRGDYTLAATNNSWHEGHFRIVSHCGPIEAAEELTLDESEKGAVGYLPKGVSATLGSGSPSTIAGGDVRIFSVRVQEQNIEEIPHTIPLPRPRNHLLRLYTTFSIQEEILRRPTFFEHFDGVVVDWRYLHDRERETLRRESRWIRRQGLQVMVDLTSGLNLYPDLRLIDNVQSDYTASMAVIEDVMVKMEILGAHHLIFSLHRFPENNFTDGQTWDSLEKTVRRLCNLGEAHGITLHLRMAADKPPKDLGEAIRFTDRVGARNLRIAPSTALLLDKEERLPKVKLGLWLISGTAHDVGGKVWNWNSPIAASGLGSRTAKLLATASEAPLVFDAVYASPEEEYLDARAIERETCKRLGN